jgi:hypothetical protein
MRLVIVAALVFGGVLSGIAQTTTTPPRVVAIGDVHGAYDEFTTILKRAGLINAQLGWAGGRATFVQTGDYTDRGTDVRKVLDLLMRLEREAKAAGGQLVTLLGNHEVMNLIGDWRDVTPEICATFVTSQSESKREHAFREYTRLTQSGAQPSPVYQQTRDEWMHGHPPGCLEYREAMSASGAYGRWLRQKPIAAQVGDTLFMHAGINPGRTAPKSIAEVIDRAREEIRRLDAYRERLARRKVALRSFTLQQILDVSIAELRHATSALTAAKADGQPPPPLDYATLREAQDLMTVGNWSVLDPEGPLWFRGYAQWEEADGSARVFSFLDSLKLGRVVVGHTVTPDRRITPRFGGRVVLIDTGMLTRAYNGTPSALEIVGSALKAIYPTEEVALTGVATIPGPLDDDVDAEATDLLSMQ